MICSDIRHFKLINDIFGIELGDNLLLKIAEGIRDNTKPGEIFGRLEKDRFAILIRKKEEKEGRGEEKKREEERRREEEASGAKAGERPGATSFLESTVGASR